jgi:hypothetical protein
MVARKVMKEVNTIVIWTDLLISALAARWRPLWMVASNWAVRQMPWYSGRIGDLWRGVSRVSSGDGFSRGSPKGFSEPRTRAAANEALSLHPTGSGATGGADKPSSNQE